MAKGKKIDGGRAVNLDSVKFAGLNRESQYKPILDNLAKVGPGQGLQVDVPKGVSIGVFQNRLNGAMRRFGPQPPKGCKFRKRATEDGKVVIACVKTKAA